jgi:hypothetical protein
MTIWAAVVGIALCYVPLVREIIHQASLSVIQFQALLHLLLRLKTSVGIGKEIVCKEEGN